MSGAPTLLLAFSLQACAAARPFYLAADERKDAAIVVLTRGYDQHAGYSQFITRGRALSSMPWAHNVDHLVYHQGDVAPEQQEYLRQATKLPMEFINITWAFNAGWQRVYAENPNATWAEKCPNKDHGSHFGFGYRTMCDWWSRLFLSDPVLKNYKSMMRIDEDITVTDMSKEWTFPNVSTHYAANEWNTNCNERGGDSLAATRGLHELLFGESTATFCSPFTEVFWINLEWARSSEALAQMMTDVDLSGCLYANRWGDLPLWGAFLHRLKEPPVELGLSYDIHHPGARHLLDDKELGGELQVGSYRWHSDWLGRKRRRMQRQMRRMRSLQQS